MRSRRSPPAALPADAGSYVKISIRANELPHPSWAQPVDVYFRRDGGRWRLARIERLERDGSIGLRDEKGAARAIPIELIEVSGTGPRGGTIWEPLAAVAARTEQLRLM